MKTNLIAMLAAFAVSIVAPAFAGEMDESLAKAPERIIIKVLEKDAKGKPTKVKAYAVPENVVYSEKDKGLTEEQRKARAEEITRVVAVPANEIDSSKVLVADIKNRSEMATESSTPAWGWRRCWGRGYYGGWGGYGGYGGYCNSWYYPYYIGYAAVSYVYNWGWNNWGFYGGCW